MMHRGLAQAGKWLAMAVIAAAVGCEKGGGPDYSGHDFGDNDKNLIVALGDSITYGEGLSSGESYPSQLGALTGRPVINTGSPGEETSGGLNRVNSVLDRYKPGFLLILYGSNDLIHNRDIGEAVSNLRGIIRAAHANKTVAIIGTVPPAFPYHDFIEGGVEEINPLIQAMASEEGAPVANVFGALNNETLFQSDGLHPTATGATKLAAAFADQL